MKKLTMKKPKIKISLIDQKGHMGCHRGHRIGDTFDFDTERVALCQMAMHNIINLRKNPKESVNRFLSLC